MLESVIGIHISSLEADDERLLSSQRYLARAYSHIGYALYGKSVEIVESVVRIYAVRSDANDDKFLSAQNLLAEGYNVIGNDCYERAVELLKQVVRVDEKNLPPNNLDWLGSEQELKDVTRLIQAEREAGSYSERAIDSFR